MGEAAGRGVSEGRRYAAIADAVRKGRSGITIQERKELKSLKGGASLRDDMADSGPLFSMLAEPAASGKVKLDGALGFDEVNRSRPSRAKGAQAARLATDGKARPHGTEKKRPAAEAFSGRKRAA